jgi:hypothetical protein
MPVGIQAVLVDAAGHLGTELFQQPVARRQRLVHPRRSVTSMQMAR